MTEQNLNSWLWLLRTCSWRLDALTHAVLLPLCILFWKNNLQIHVKRNFMRSSSPSALTSKNVGNSTLSVIWFQRLFLAYFSSCLSYRLYIPATCSPILWCSLFLCRWCFLHSPCTRTVSLYDGRANVTLLWQNTSFISPVAINQFFSVSPENNAYLYFTWFHSG